MNLDLAGRHALVCGASEGIGRASAVQLAALGADVTVLSRRADALDAVLATLDAARGQRHGRIAVDVGDTAQLKSLVEALVSSKPVQILINNAGGPPGGAAHKATSDEFTAGFRNHVVAAQTLLQAVLPGMRAAGWGRVVNVISTSVKEPIPGLGVSNTIRGAMASWAKTIATELAPHGITVNNVLPGFTQTGRLASLIAGKARAAGRSEDDIAADMIASVPAGRFAQAEEIANVVAFLCTPAAAYVNGINVPVDGGRTRSL